uniref:BTB domain-containing protein n=1 Tax=Panagrolaimus superbus TaxID=310955 RepID=A0A914XT00_9BILA
MSSSDGNTGFKRLDSDLLQTLRAMQNERYKIFQQQDVDKGRFDVTFEIEGKHLHAHKFTLTSISKPLDSWLSDRWTTKDEVVKIEDSSYDEFYEFLTFLYTSECKLTEENIVKMTDMAEFYGVQCLKELCDEFLAKNEKTVETIEELFNFAQKYSLPKLEDSLKSFFWNHYRTVCKSDAFIDFKKPFIEFLLAGDISLYKKQILFEGVNIQMG